jgi:protein CpxP
MKIRMAHVVALALCELALAAPESNAQAQRTASTAPGTATNEQKLDKLEALSKQLNLTPDQKMKLFPILKAEAPKMQAIKDNTSLTKIQKLERIRTLHEQTDPQVQAILSPQQYQQLKDIRQQEIEKMVQKKRATQ